MAKQLVRYRLNADGTVPDFLYLGAGGFSGLYGVADAKPWPRDLVQVGMTDTTATGDFEVFPTKQSFLEYLISVGADWQQRAEDGTLEPFNPNAAADWAWGMLDALNG